MTEQPGSGPPEVALSGQDLLLATKLHVPRLQPGFVPRPRLTERLDEGLARGFVLVSAPAGYGKTALLADWARSGRRPVAWLSLDAADSDPARFWRYVVTALDRVRPGIGELAGVLLGPPAPRSFEGLVTALINELARQPDEDQVLLILDDYHLIDSQPVHGSLTYMLEHLPPGLRLGLASRSDPPLALAPLRVRGQLAELRAAELRFTAEEAVALLHEAAGSGLPDAALAMLAARTEGWAAGLQLAGLSLRGQADVESFVATFSGSHRYVLDYLAGEVLERQAEQVRTFLLETSVLERLSGALCDAVTRRTDSQAMLEAIERAGLFLVPLDEVRAWWRYHQLFADLLRARLLQQSPDQVPALHRRAAAWSEEHGLIDDAARHALGAGDAAWATRLIERHVDALLLRSEGATLQRWMAALPAELAACGPRLMLAQARLALLGGRTGAAQVGLDAAERAFAATPGFADAAREPPAGKAASVVANIPASIANERAYLAELRGDPESAMAFASRALAEIGEGEWMLASHARGYLALAEWLSGRVEEAERAISAAVTEWRAAGDRYLELRGCHHLGQVQRAQGRLDAAFGTYQQALHVGAAPARLALPVVGIAYVGLAEVAYQQGELEAALRHVTEGIAGCRQLAYTQPLATGLAALAWIRHAQGDPAAALNAIEEAERVAPGADVIGLLNPVPAQRARLLLAWGDVSGAARWAQDRGLSAHDEPLYPREPDYLVLVRVLIAQHRPRQALALLERLHTAAAAQGRTGSVIEIQALQALALAADGEEATAVRSLARTLILACPQGYVRVFADEGPPMRALLGRLTAIQKPRYATAGLPSGYLARVQQASRATHGGARAGRGAAATVPGLVEPLTERELEVLRLLTAGRPNQAIADELVITLDTVKKHVSHVLRKLGAANRTEAVTRARELALLR
jgi:LuxR family maltose regulon positive regulatory protein